MMLDTNTLKKAVELADGWFLEHDDEYIEHQTCLLFELATVKDCPQPIIDALAMQLWRQVDVLDDYNIFLSADRDNLAVIFLGPDNWIDYIGTDRSENIINAIVQSGVLEKEDK